MSPCPPLPTTLENANQLKPYKMEQTTTDKDYSLATGTVKKSRNKFAPGSWVKYLPDPTVKEIGLIAHDAEPYVQNNPDTYFVYWFTPEGKYVDAGLYGGASLGRTKNDRFAGNITLFPKLLVPIQTDDIENCRYQAGFVCIKHNLVVIDTLKMNSPLLVQFIVEAVCKMDSKTRACGFIPKP